MKYISIFFTIFIMFGCSSKNTNIPIYDLENIPQNIDYFTKNISNNENYFNIQNNYQDLFYSVYTLDKPKQTLEDIKWPFKSYTYGESYGVNLQLLDKSFFEDMYNEANFKDYLTLNRYALTIKHTNIRAFPTIKPLLKNPHLAGEGYPFDYLQNSLISMNKPLFISHFSKMKKWAYAFSSFTSGWVLTRDIVFLEKNEIDEFLKLQKIFITKENVPLYDNDNNFVSNSRVGMLLPIIDEKEKEYTALIASKDKNAKLYYMKVNIPKEISTKNILKFNKENINSIIKEVSKTNYAWGGLYEQRDCSSTIRDIFAPFGIWLPRNSYEQSKVGTVISLKGLKDKDKILKIKKFAIPFQTLIYKKGHILLYIGTYNNEVVVYHNTWGIKTFIDKKEGRIIVGKPVITTLEFGKKQVGYNKKSSLLTHIVSMNILTI